MGEGDERSSHLEAIRRVRKRLSLTDWKSPSSDETEKEERGPAQAAGGMDEESLSHDPEPSENVEATDMDHEGKNAWEDEDEHAGPHPDKYTSNSDKGEGTDPEGEETADEVTGRHESPRQAVKSMLLRLHHLRTSSGGGFDLNRRK